MIARSQTIITGFDPKGPFGGLWLPERLRKRQSETRFKQEWTLTPLQYAQMMREKFCMRAKRWIPMRKYQRGNFAMFPAGTVSVGSRGFVFLSGLHGFESDEIGASSTSGVRFESDGQLWEVNSAFGDAEQAGEWWSEEPETGIGSSYEVRALSGGSGTWGNAAAADDTWITINVNRTWDHTRSSSGTTIVSRTFEVGLDGVESALDSSLISCTATWS